MRIYRSINNFVSEPTICSGDDMVDITCYESLNQLIDRIVVRGEQYTAAKMMYDGDDLDFESDGEPSTTRAAAVERAVEVVDGTPSTIEQAQPQQLTL